MSLDKIASGESKTEEEIEDIVGAMADAGYGLSYDDAAGLIASTRRGPNPFDAAKSFKEPELSITTTNTVVADGSVGLFNRMRAEEACNESYQQDGADRGLQFELARPVDSLTVEISELATNVDRVELYEGVDNTGTQIDGTGYVGDGPATVTLTPANSLSANTTYAVYAGSDSTWDYARSINLDSLPGGDGIDVTAGLVGTSTFDDRVYSFDAIYAGEPATSGSVTVEWPTPEDIHSWDVATYTRTLAGETVDVFVGVNDGTGWSRANGGAPITRNYSLADDPAVTDDDDVRIEAELSRNDTSNDPELDSAYRSWWV